MFFSTGLSANDELQAKVTSVFPKAGIIMLNGQRMPLSSDVQVVDESGRFKDGETPGIEAVTPGSIISYEWGVVDGKSVIQKIIITD